MNGVLILDKPENFTSFDAVAVVRKLARERKIGHTGTLDPMATGVLPLLLGRAAKAADLLPDTDKEYRASFRFGQRYDTGDITGTLLETSDTSISKEQLIQALPAFRGEILQVPPMYSAVSVGGKRLYELARKGIEVERTPRPVTIHRLELLEYDETTRTGQLLVSCSKGTYIRTLIEDIAAALHTCGTMTALRRTAACGFTAEEAISLEELKQAAADGKLEETLRPTESLFFTYPAVQVSPAQASRFCNGGSLAMERLRIAGDLADSARMRVQGPEREFLGLGQVDLAAGELKFLKLFKEDTP